MEFETILYEQQDGVAIITLNRPARHNAITLAMSQELRQAWDRVKKDPQVVCAILTGGGDRADCTSSPTATSSCARRPPAFSTPT